MSMLIEFSFIINDLEHKFEVLDFVLEEGISELFKLEVNVAVVNSLNTSTADTKQTDFTFALDKQLLQPSTFTIETNNTVLRSISGIVASIKYIKTINSKAYYTFEIRPKLWLLTLNQDSRIYQAKSVPDILDEILTRHNINLSKPLKNDLQFTHAVREYVTQKRESDYDFFCRLAAEEGIIFFFTENGLFVNDYNSAALDIPSLQYNLNPQAALQHGFVINQFAITSGIKANTVSIKDYKHTHPEANISACAKVNTEANTGYEVYESYGRINGLADEQISIATKQFAQYRLEQLTNDSLFGTAKSNCITLMPGTLFNLTNHPIAHLNTLWQVIKIKHQGAMPHLITNLDQTTNQTNQDKNKATLINEFTFISAKNHYRAPFRYKPLADGNELATVVGPNDEEIWVNAEGAVKVHFHWDRTSEANEHSSCFIRVAQNISGDGFGTVTIPRIGQEVIISYLNGDIDKPIIIGTLYNGINRPPINLPDNKTQTTIKTKTHKGEGFNELRFEDKKDNEQIFIHAQKNMDIHIQNDQNKTIGNNQITNITNNEQLLIGNNQIIIVEGNQEKTLGSAIELIKNNKNLTIEGNLIEQINGYSSLKVNNNLLMQSNENITFSVGTNTIVIDTSGIYVNGNVLNLNNGKIPAVALNPLSPNQVAITDNSYTSSYTNNLTNNYASIATIDEIKQKLNEGKYATHPQFFVKNTRIPHANVPYIATMPDGTQEQGITDNKGCTKIFYLDEPQKIVVHLKLKDDKKNDNVTENSQKTTSTENENSGIDEAKNKVKANSNYIKYKYDINKAVAHLDGNALNKSIGKCAQYVREAINAGGISVTSKIAKKNRMSAYQYANFLPEFGFYEVSIKNYNPQKGDIIVINAFTGKTEHKHGHIAMYNGSRWISDFKQKDMWAGSDYRKHQPSHKHFRWQE